VRHNLLDHTLLLQIPHGLAGNGTVYLQTIDEDGNGDETVRLDILLELVCGGFVEDDSVVGLVLDCNGSAVVSQTGTTIRTLSLGPLLLSFLATGCCWRL